MDYVLFVVFQFQPAEILQFAERHLLFMTNCIFNIYLSLRDLKALKYARMRDLNVLRYAKLLTYLQIPFRPPTVYDDIN